MLLSFLSLGICRIRDLIQKGARKRKEAFVVLEIRFFFPERGGLFFPTSIVSFSSGCTAQSIPVVLSLVITRDFEISREKRTSRNRFVRSSAFFPRASPLGASRNDCSE